MRAGALPRAVGKRSNRDYTWHTIPFPRVAVEGLAQRSQACVPGEPPLPVCTVPHTHTSDLLGMLLGHVEKAVMKRIVGN